MSISGIRNQGNILPTVSLASPAQMLRNARTVVVTAVALAALANLPQVEAGPFLAIAAGLIVKGAGVALLFTPFAPAGAALIAAAPAVAAGALVAPTP